MTAGSDGAAAARWGSAQHLLCVRAGGVGDVLLATPAIRALREGRRITLLTSPAGAAAARLVPEVDTVIACDAAWLADASSADAEPDAPLAAALRRLRVDAAVIFTSSDESPLAAARLCTAAGIPLRLGYGDPGACGPLTDVVVDGDAARGRPEALRLLHLTAAVGCGAADERLSLRTAAEHRWRAAQLLDSVGLDVTMPWAVVHPGESDAAAPFAQVVRRLARDHRWHIVLTGDDAALAAGIREAAGVPARLLAGRLDTGELAAVIEAAPVLVAGDGDAAQIAAAVGTPVVDVHAAGRARHPAWTPAARVVAADAPDRVVRAAVELVDAAEAAPLEPAHPPEAQAA